MNTMNTTRPVEKDTTVTSEQMQSTGTDTPQKRHGSFVSIDPNTSPKKDVNKTIKISTSDVHVYYGESEAIKGIDLEVYENEVIAFIGPSGCGKSTFCVP